MEIKQRDLANIDTLSAKDLDEFCLYWNSGPGRDAEKEKAKALKLGSEPDYPRGLYNCCALSCGWTFCDHRYENTCLLCDEEDTVRLKGNSIEIVGLLLNIAIRERTLAQIGEREYGLVLSGGGAKGAFEIGVWRWLERTGLIHKITGISGASVGALNSVLISCASIEEAEDIWLSIRQDDLTPVNWEALRKGAETLMRMAAGTAALPVNAVMMAKELSALAGGSVFTQGKLSEIVKRVLERKIPNHRIVFSCLARQSLQKQADPPTELL
ncbi:MAG TPA: hypothetical protein DEO87_03455, partial [Lachnospiraceae bacterium]|nr:hypothetical protein [Lachnospiraceae bacterium]